MILKYRPEIDGLRAIAIIMVLLFHAESQFFKNDGSRLFENSFIGVDIFFVISGYLITRIILNKLATNSFTLAWFYEKRARRLLPALFLVVITSLILARFKMLPHEMLIHAEASIYSLLFASNILYWLQTSYWIAEASVYPLLHTWSLAVEEHFYIIFPPILMLLWKFQPKHIMTAIIAFSIASFTLAVTMTPNFSDFTFYLLPARMWELMAGAFLANFEFRKKENSKEISKSTTAFFNSLAVVIIAYSFSPLSDIFPHPSYPTLIPIVGTMMLIKFAGGDDIVSQILKSKLFVSIGLISYSLYLWHYLIFAFWSYIATDFFSEMQTAIAATLLTFVVAIAAYFLVEQPARGKKIGLKKFAYTCIALFIACTGFAGSIIYTKGYLHTMPLAKVITIPGEDWNKQTDEKGNRCLRRDENFCTFIVAEDAKYVLLVGDSASEALALGLRPALKENNFNLIMLNSETCYFAPTARRVGWGTCLEEYQKARLDEILKHSGSIVVVSGLLDIYLEDKDYEYQSSTNRKLDVIVYEEIIKLLKADYTVVHLAPQPTSKKYRTKLSRFIKTKKVNNLMDSFSKEDLIKIGSYPIEQYFTHSKVVFDLMKKIEEQGYLNYKPVYPHKIFCDTYVEKTCVFNDGEYQLLSDEYHYTTIGATEVAKLILEEIKEVK